MDEYVSEKEQIERLRQWWRENGWFLLAGAALGGIALFGWWRYQAYQVGQAEEAAALYLDLKEAIDGDQLDEARALLAKLRAEHADSAYTHQGGMLVAGNLIATTPDEAIAELRRVMEGTSDRELSMVARLRLARVLAYRERYDEALQLLDVEDQGNFTGLFNEVSGDIYAAMGRIDEARSAYLGAMMSPGSEVLDRGYLQMKLGELFADAAAAEPPPAAPAAPAPVGETSPAPDAAAAPAEPAAAVPAAADVAAPAGEATP